jgi:hypothetical protein
MTACDGLSQRPAINVDTEWQALRLHSVFGDEGTDHFAGRRYLRRELQHSALKHAATPRARAAVVDVC